MLYLSSSNLCAAIREIVYPTLNLYYSSYRQEEGITLAAEQLFSAFYNFCEGNSAGEGRSSEYLHGDHRLKKASLRGRTKWWKKGQNSKGH